MKPMTPILPALMREPGDFVITPDPVAAHPRLSRMFTDAPVIQFNQVAKVFAGPAAVRDATFAPAINAIGKAGLQNCYLRLIRHFHNPQWEGMEIQQQFAITRKTAAW